jgi:BlaI family transcriptional regulator, penicillinase repressor
MSIADDLPDPLEPNCGDCAMKNRGLDQLGRRERQIMEIIYRRGRANAAEVLADIPDPPTYTAVRGMLRLLESKGHLRHEQDGPRYVYFPTADHGRVSKSAVRHLVKTFFDNSASSAVAAMVGMYEDRWSDSDLASLEKVIEKARGKGGAS